MHDGAIGIGTLWGVYPGGGRPAVAGTGNAQAWQQARVRSCSAGAVGEHGIQLGLYSGHLRFQSFRPEAELVGRELFRAPPEAPR